MTTDDITALRDLLDAEPQRWQPGRRAEHIGPCWHDWIEDRQIYRDEFGVVFSRACAICGLHQEAPIDAAEFPRSLQLIDKMRSIIRAGGLDELEQVVSQVQSLVTADAWRVA
jgi:hypothetical protein